MPPPHWHWTSSCATRSGTGGGIGAARWHESPRGWHMSGQFVLSPLSWSIALLMLLVFAWHRLPRALRYAGIAFEMLVVLSMTPLGANLLVRAVESRTPSARLCLAPFPAAIVLL